MKISSVFAAATIAAGLATPALLTAGTVAGHDFTGATLPNLAGFQAGRDLVDGVRPIGAGHVVEGEGFLKFPDIAGTRYYTRAKALYELPASTSNWSIETRFQYKDITTPNCSFGLTWHDFGAENSLPNQSIRMGLNIDGSGWKAVVGRTEAWAQISTSPYNFAQPPVVDDPMTLTVTKTGPSTVDITLVSQANGVLLNITGADFSGLGMPTEYGQFALYNAAFGGPTFNPVYVDYITLRDSSNNVLFTDDFNDGSIDRNKWLVNDQGVAIDNALWPEAFPNRPTVRGGRLQMSPISISELLYCRAVVNNNIRPVNPTVTAKFILTDVNRPTGDAGIFGVKIRQNGDETTSIVALLDPDADQVRIGNNNSFNGIAGAQSAPFTMNQGDTVYMRVTASGPSVTVEAANNPNFTGAVTVTKNDFSGARLNPGSIMFFASNINMIELDEFNIDDPDTSVADWQLF